MVGWWFSGYPNPLTSLVKDHNHLDLKRELQVPDMKYDGKC